MLDLEHHEIDEASKSALSYVNIVTNSSNIKEKNNDVLKVLDSSQKKLKTVQFFKKQALVEVTPFEYYNIKTSLKATVQSYEERRKSHLSDLEVSTFKMLTDCLAQVGSFDFDIFDIDSIVGKKALRYISFEIFNKFNFFEEILDESKYKNFIERLTDGYDRNIIYHNDLHATDVLQTMYVMIEKGSLVDVI
jgi:hypothetical protein